MHIDAEFYSGNIFFVLVALCCMNRQGEGMYLWFHFRMGGFILYQPLCFIESVLRCGGSTVEERQWGIVGAIVFFL